MCFNKLFRLPQPQRRAGILCSIKRETSTQISGHLVGQPLDCKRAGGVELQPFLIKTGREPTHRGIVKHRSLLQTLTELADTVEPQGRDLNVKATCTLSDIVSVCKRRRPVKD